MSETLYERLGGREAIAAVVESFYERVLDDERVAHFFEDTDVASLRAHQTRFLAAAAGGPVEYDGADMETAHAHLDIREEDFEVIAVHLDEAMASFDVPPAERDEVLTAVGELEPAVVSA
ncbi:group I truncated hemoglobin [Halorussus sp. AFM4]|uniref:group I truncated hemoglobin n=1 Tax=Halorussus sp. AFM4 TaxID=3421651 RepID=UPI003EB976D3